MESLSGLAEEPERYCSVCLDTRAVSDGHDSDRGDADIFVLDIMDLV